LLQDERKADEKRRHPLMFMEIREEGTGGEERMRRVLRV